MPGPSSLSLCSCFGMTSGNNTSYEGLRFLLSDIMGNLASVLILANAKRCCSPFPRSTVEKGSIFHLDPESRNTTPRYILKSCEQPWLVAECSSACSSRPWNEGEAWHLCASRHAPSQGHRLEITG